MVYMSQPCTHPCARKPRPRPRSNQMFWNLHLNGVTKIAHSARGSARAVFSICNLNLHENVDAFWLLGHWHSLKSEETGFMWIWCVFKKFQFWKFFKISKKLIFWRDIIQPLVVRLLQWVLKIWQWPSMVKGHLFLSKNHMIYILQPCTHPCARL